MSGTWDWLDGGGRAVLLTSYPDSVPENLRPHPTVHEHEDARAVTVKGQPGVLRQAMVNNHSTNLITIEWTSESAEGVYLGWVVMADGDHISADDALAWANSLKSAN